MINERLIKIIVISASIGIEANLLSKFIFFSQINTQILSLLKHLRYTAHIA